MRTLLLTGWLALSSVAVAMEDRALIARYAYLIPGSSHAQRHPLQVTVTQVRFPQEVANVGEALHYLLSRSGYRLDEQRSHWARAILMPQPLPEVHRDLGPIHLADALGVLAGDAWRLKVNPLYRTLIIEPTETWQAQLEATPGQLEIEQAHEGVEQHQASAQPVLRQSRIVEGTEKVDDGIEKCGADQQQTASSGVGIGQQ